MATIGSTPRPGFVYDAESTTWIPIGTGPHSHSAYITNPLTTKGDIIAANATALPTRLSVGGNGTILVADSGSTVGIAWSNLIQPANASTTGLILRAQTSQTANLIEWQSSTASILGKITGAGVFDIQYVQNPQTGTSYTVVAADSGKLVEMNNAAANTLLVPTNASVAFPIGTQINILQTGAGQTTVAAVTPATTTINATPGLKFRDRWSSATLIKRATDTWVLVGDTIA